MIEITAMKPHEFRFGLRSSPNVSAAAQGYPHYSSEKLPLGGADGGGHHIIVDMELEVIEAGEIFADRLAASQSPLDPQISELVDKYFWDLL